MKNETSNLWDTASRRAKWIMMAFALICLLEILYAALAITSSSENPTEKISLYYQKAQSDLEKPSSGLEHALGEDDGFISYKIAIKLRC
jgi:hypothetical protein